MKNALTSACCILAMAALFSACTQHHPEPYKAPANPAAQPTFSKEAQKTMIDSGVVMAEQAKANSATVLLNSYAQNYQSKHGTTSNLSDFVVTGRSNDEDIAGLSDLNLDNCTLSNTEIDCTKNFRTINVTYQFNNGQVTADIQKRF